MSIIDSILDIFYPPRCIVCGEIAVKNGKYRYLCKTCKKNIPWVTDKNRCEICSRPLEIGEKCEICAKHDNLYDYAISVFDYAVMKNTIEDYKFNGHKYLSRGIGEVMFRYADKFYSDILNETDIIVPLPIHKNRLKERGFDQSVLIAEILAEESSIKYAEALERIKETSQQSLMTGYRARKENVKDAFAVKSDVFNKTVMVIDDVLTTGSSASECARALKKAGAKKVIVYTLSASFKPLNEFRTTDNDDNNA